MTRRQKSVFERHADRIAREDARMPKAIRDVLSPPTPPLPRANHDLAYGRIEVHAYDAPWRDERYVPHDGSRPVWERIMCAGPEDVSTRHAVYPNGYDSACSCCYLNISHTEDKHRACGGKAST